MLVSSENAQVTQSKRSCERAVASCLNLCSETHIHRHRCKFSVSVFHTVSGKTALAYKLIFAGQSPVYLLLSFPKASKTPN